MMVSKMGFLGNHLALWACGMENCGCMVDVFGFIVGLGHPLVIVGGFVVQISLLLVPGPLKIGSKWALKKGGLVVVGG